MINQRQFSHLQEIGITLYQRKALNNANEENHSSVNIDIDAVTNDLLFADILQSLSLSLADIELHTRHIDMGLFNWHFHEQDAITCSENQLVTPTLATIKSSTSLKQALWHTIYNHLL